jgi:hypothetical protein
MIAGRLVYHHKLQRKVVGGHSVSYLPVLVIFIESGVLSTLSKVMQLALAFYGQIAAENPIIIPLCVRNATCRILSIQVLKILQTLASDLIILRKALGADVTQMVATPERLSTIRFQSRHAQLPVMAEGGSIPGGFESHLIEVVGGHNFKGSFSDFQDEETEEKPEGRKEDQQKDRKDPRRRHSFAV